MKLALQMVSEVNRLRAG